MDTASRDIAQVLGQITGVHDYRDAIQFWLRKPLSNKERRFLNDHSDKLLRGKDIHVREPAGWDQSRKQVIRLYQPKDDAIKFLAEREDILLNYVELARDFILPDEAKVQELLKFTGRHFVQRWHRSRVACIFHNGNYRTGKLHKPGVVSRLTAIRHQRSPASLIAFISKRRSPAPLP